MLTETAPIGIAALGVIRCIMQSPEVNNIMKNLKGNHKLQARACTKLMEDPEIYKTVEYVSRNDKIKKSISNIDINSIKKIGKIGLSIYKYHRVIPPVFTLLPLDIGNIETLENVFTDFFAMKNDFIENLFEIGSEGIVDTAELIQEAGEVSYEAIDFILGIVDFI
jgi:hypothetical protein